MLRINSPMILATENSSVKLCSDCHKNWIGVKMQPVKSPGIHICGKCRIKIMISPPENVKQQSK